MKTRVLFSGLIYVANVINETLKIISQVRGVIKIVY